MKLVAPFDEAGFAFIDESVASIGAGRGERLKGTQAITEAPSQPPPEVLPLRASRR